MPAMASAAAGVRNVTSAQPMPPSRSALASGTASCGLSIVITGTRPILLSAARASAMLSLPDEANRPGHAGPATGAPTFTDDDEPSEITLSWREVCTWSTATPPTTNAVPGATHSSHRRRPRGCLDSPTTAPWPGR